jgi:hypothetical protein
MPDNWLQRVPHGLVYTEMALQLFNPCSDPMPVRCLTASTEFTATQPGILRLQTVPVRLVRI